MSNLKSKLKAGKILRTELNSSRMEFSLFFQCQLTFTSVDVPPQYKRIYIFQSLPKPSQQDKSVEPK